MFEEFEGECTKVKMCKPCKKKNPACSYEGPYIFVTYKDGKGFQEQDEGSKICITKDIDKKHWERARKDLHIYHFID